MRKDNHACEELNDINQAIAVGVPDREHGFRHTEYLLKLLQAHCEGLAQHAEAGVQLSNFRNGFFDQADVARDDDGVCDDVVLHRLNEIAHF